MRPVAADSQGDFSHDHKRQIQALQTVDWIWEWTPIINIKVFGLSSWVERGVIYRTKKYEKRTDFRENNLELCFKLPGFVEPVDTEMDLLKG